MRLLIADDHALFGDGLFNVRNTLGKLRLHNRAEVVGYALRHGIVEPPGR